MSRRLGLGCALAATGVLSGATTATNRVAELARAVSRQVEDARPEGPIAIHLRADSIRLAEGFTTLLAAELARAKLTAIPLDPDSPDPIAVAWGYGARTLLRLQIWVDAGALRVEGDLFGTWINFWSGKLPTRPPSPATLIGASVAADPELLALFPASAGLPRSAGVRDPLSLRRTTLAKLPMLSAALAAGDLDGDGKDEVVVLTDSEIVALSADGEVLARRQHQQLPSSLTPCREPFGTVVIQRQPSRIAYFSCQRAKGELLAIEAKSRQFASWEPLEEIPLPPIQGTGALKVHWAPGENTFRAAAVASGGAPPALAKPFSSLSTFTVRGEGQYWVILPAGDGLWVRDSLWDRQPVKLPGVGVGSGWVDFDGAGVPRLVASSPQFQPAPEEIRVLSFAPDPTDAGASRGFGNGSPHPVLVWQDGMTLGRVAQVVAADFTGRGRQSAVLAIWMPDGTTELQVLERSTLR